MRRFLLRAVVLVTAFMLGPAIFGLTILGMLLYRFSPTFRNSIQGIGKGFANMGRDGVVNTQLNQKQLHRKYDKVLGVKTFLRRAECLFIDQNGEAVMALDGCPYKFSSYVGPSGRTTLESVIIPKEYEKAVMEFLNERGLLRSVVLVNDDFRSRMGGFSIVSNDADKFLDVMDSLGRIIASKRANRIEMTVTNTNRYAVPGCGSYEEALKVLSDSGDRERFLVRCTTIRQAELNGEVLPVDIDVSGVGADDADRVVTQLGTFIIEESSVQHFSGVVEGDASDGKVLVDKAVMEGALVARDTPEYEYVDRTDMSVREVLIQGRPFRVVSQSMSDDDFISLAGGRREFVVRADSMDKVLPVEADASLNARVQPEGGGAAPQNDYVMTVPVTVSSSLHTVSDNINQLSKELMDTYGMNGLTPAEARLTACAYLMSMNDDLTVSIEPGRVSDIEGVRINGVDCREVKSFRESEIGRSMDEERMRNWLHDAALVQDVDVKVDPETMKMNVSVEYAGGRRADFSRNVDADELARIADRDINMITKKDLAMHLLAGKVGDADGDGPSFIAYPEFDWQKGNSYLKQNECLDAFVEGRQPHAPVYSAPEYARKNEHGMDQANDVKVRTGLTM